MMSKICFEIRIILEKGYVGRNDFEEIILKRWFWRNDFGEMILER